MGRGLQVALLGLLAALSSRLATAQCPTGQLTQGIAGDAFGQGLAAGEDELVVASLVAARVYVRDDHGTPLNAADDEWLLQTDLFTQDPFLADGYGYAVAINDDHLVVGAPFAGGGFAGPGTAYVYRREDNGTPANKEDDGWIEQAKLVGIQTSGAQFGISVSLTRSRVVVGAPTDFPAAGPPPHGLAFVYVRDDLGTADPADDIWVEEVVLSQTDGELFDRFGSEVLIQERDLFVGADGVDRGGAVYHFRLDDSGTPQAPGDDVWIEHAKIQAPASDATLLFGRAIAWDGTALLVGALGKAYAFGLDDMGTPFAADDAWELRATVTSADTVPGDDFGASVAVQGSRALIGAPKHSVLGTLGVAYLFYGSTSGAGSDVWTQVAKLVPQLVGSQKFGAAVLLAQDQAFVGESGSFQGLAPDFSTGAVTTYAMEVEPWSFLEAGVPGPSAACLYAAGSVTPLSEVVVCLHDAASNAQAVLVIGLSALNLPFKQGVLIPSPDLLVLLSTDSAGQATLSAQWPAGTPAGLPFFLQAWIADPGAPSGLAGTNAISAIAQ